MELVTNSARSSPGSALKQRNYLFIMATLQHASLWLSRHSAGQATKHRICTV